MGQISPWFPAEPALPGVLAQRAPVVACFAQGTDPGYVQAVTTFLNLRNQQLGGVVDYHTGARWPGTVGTPVNLTWSFVPDGVVVSSGSGEPSAASELFAQMDSAFSGQGGRATWVNRFQQIFDRWSQLGGITFTRVQYNGNDWDDGAAWGSAGAAGFRGDLRISMHYIDGPSNVLAYCFFPNSGDMVIDSADAGSFSGSLNQHRFLRNCIGHELGHGLGLDHTCPTNSTKLMEPFIWTNNDGPRQDDIRAIEHLYGDPLESNNTSGTAKPVGALVSGSPITVGAIPNPPTGTSDPNASTAAIETSGSVDYYSFTTGGATSLTATLTPIGSTYDNSPQNGNGSCASGNNENALAIADLVLTLYSTNGTTVLASANANGAGMGETVSNLTLPAAGTYFAKVSAANAPTESQLYTLTLSGNCATTPTFVMQPPSQLVQNGANFALAGLANNANSYQWRKNNIPLSDDGRIVGSHTPTLTIHTAHQSDGGSYTLVATGSCAQSTSQPALITVECYSNCDGSTTAPVLSVSDYMCFLTRFTSGDPWANCDGSTTPPTLNLFDFICYQHKFAQGCL